MVRFAIQHALQHHPDVKSNDPMANARFIRIQVGTRAHGVHCLTLHVLGSLRGRSTPKSVEHPHAGLMAW